MMNRRGPFSKFCLTNTWMDPYGTTTAEGAISSLSLDIIDCLSTTYQVAKPKSYLLVPSYSRTSNE